MSSYDDLTIINLYIKKEENPVQKIQQKINEANWFLYVIKFF